MIAFLEFIAKIFSIFALIVKDIDRNSGIRHDIIFSLSNLFLQLI
jgi:hypothetical protein